jgi:CRP/FNR family cyclic AMP-dependent transcriptional regulator
MKRQNNAPRSETEKLFSSGQKLSFKRGEIIQRASETPQGVYFLHDGFVREFTVSDDGGEHLTVVYEPGDVFSLNWMYLDITPNVFRQAHTACALYRLGPDAFRKELRANHALQLELISMQMRHIHMLSSRVENLTFSNAYDKVAYHLVHLAGRFGEPHPDGWFITLPFRHQQIAESLSMTRETASRMIERIERQGLIRQDGKGHFIIKDVSALASTIGVEEVLGLWPRLQNKRDNNHN